CEKTQDADHGVVEAGPDGVAVPGSATAHQGRANPERGVYAGDHIADRLGDEIEGRAVAIRPAAAKPGNIAVDECGVERPEPRLVETHVYENSGAEILDQDIAAGDQLGQHLAALFVPQVEGQR